MSKERDNPEQVPRAPAKPPPKPAAGRAPAKPAGPRPPPKPGQIGASTAEAQETLSEDKLARAATHSRMRARADEEPTSDIIPLVNVPPPGKDADKYIGCTIDGRYVVLSVLGEGGMGVVYKCRRRIFEKTVAVKILRADLAKSTEATERFVTEAKAASAIGNAHIVDVLDFGVLPDGSTYFAMEYLEGPTLADLIEEGVLLGSPRVVEIGRQLAEGLAAAHEAKIVHRDLKPDNIFVIDQEGQDFVKIVDFGIAKVAGAANKLTRAGAIFGTPHYMSPEQCRGKSVDHRTDIYSLGIMLYELIVGEVPFDAENPLSIMSMHLHDPPLPPSAVDNAPPLPDGLERVILKCLAKDPEGRFQSMTEVADALRAVRRGESLDEIVVPISVFPPPDEAPHSLSEIQPNLYPDPESAPEPATVIVEQEIPLPLTAPRSTPSSLAAKPPPADLSRIVSDAAVEREWERANRSSRWPWLLLVLGTLGLGGGYAYYDALANSGPVPRTLQAGRPLVMKDFLASAAASPKETKVTSVALVMSPLDARVFIDGKDLGSMPVSVDVPEGEIVSVEIKRNGYFPRKVKLDGSKQKKLVRLAPIPGSRAAAPAKERSAQQLGFAKDEETTEEPAVEAAPAPKPHTWKIGEPADPTAPAPTPAPAPAPPAGSGE
ncbi:MAG: serine/threonine-protein kinase [Polyangiaceae bacterium]